MGNGRKTTDNRLTSKDNRQPVKDNRQLSKDNGQRSKDAVNGLVDCLFLLAFIPYCVGWRRSTLRLYRHWIELISSENISCIYFIFYIIQTGIVTVGYYGLRHLLKCVQVIDHPASKEGGTIL